MDVPAIHWWMYKILWQFLRLPQERWELRTCSSQMGTDTQDPSHFYMKLIIKKKKKNTARPWFMQQLCSVNVGINQTQYPIRNNGTGMS
jgi:hypothetical protein